MDGGGVMTRNEIVAALLKGAKTAGCEYISVKREDLIVALEPERDKESKLKEKPHGEQA